MFLPRKDPKDLKPGHEQMASVEDSPSGHSPADHPLIYDYRADNGALFTCIAKNLDDARIQCQIWFRIAPHHVTDELWQEFGLLNRIVKENKIQTDQDHT